MFIVSSCSWLASTRISAIVTRPAANPSRNSSVDRFVGGFNPGEVLLAASGVLPPAVAGDLPSAPGTGEPIRLLTLPAISARLLRERGQRSALRSGGRGRRRGGCRRVHRCGGGRGRRRRRAGRLLLRAERQRLLGAQP